MCVGANGDTSVSGTGVRVSVGALVTCAESVLLGGSVGGLVSVADGTTPVLSVGTIVNSGRAVGTINSL